MAKTKKTDESNADLVAVCRWLQDDAEAAKRGRGDTQNHNRQQAHKALPALQAMCGMSVEEAAADEESESAG